MFSIDGSSREIGLLMFNVNSAVRFEEVFLRVLFYILLFDSVGANRLYQAIS